MIFFDGSSNNCLVCVCVCCPVTRLEEREADMKKEYNALHQRHTEVTSLQLTLHWAAHHPMVKRVPHPKQMKIASSFSFHVWKSPQAFSPNLIWNQASEAFCGEWQQKHLLKTRKTSFDARAPNVWPRGFSNLQWAACANRVASSTLWLTVKIYTERTIHKIIPSVK